MPLRAKPNRSKTMRRSAKNVPPQRGSIKPYIGGEEVNEAAEHATYDTQSISKICLFEGCHAPTLGIN